MLQVDEVAESLVQIALMSPSAVVEEIVLMPAAGAF
jgi:hypothetical protein